MGKPATKGGRSLARQCLLSSFVASPALRILAKPLQLRNPKLKILLCLQKPFPIDDNLRLKLLKKKFTGIWLFKFDTKVDMFAKKVRSAKISPVAYPLHHKSMLHAHFRQLPKELL